MRRPADGRHALPVTCRAKFGHGPWAVSPGALPEAVAFSRDGAFLYVGNFLDGTVSVLRRDGDRLVSAGPPLPLGGHPAAMR